MIKHITKVNQNASSATITTIGVDLAKNLFAVHGVDASGKPVLVRPNVRREQLLELLAQLPACLIGMEACSGAHHWARQLQALGHTPKLMAPKFVAPYRMAGKQGKNDANDAAAICEAVTRPNMRFVPIKTADAQASLSVHRVRQGFIEERTATINRIRGLLAEFGVVLPQKTDSVRRGGHLALETLPHWAHRALSDLLDHMGELDRRITEYDHHLKQVAQSDERSRRLMTMPGIGPITASALLAAWLGLVPGQHSSGGKAKLGRITKAGDRYLRTLLILGARSVLAVAARKTDPISLWAQTLQTRAGYGKALVAIAAKNARMAWAILARGEAYRVSVPI